MQSIDLGRLAAFFAAEDIEWKPIAVSKKTGKALAAAYVTNRAIMDRLDEVVGPENWRNTFKPGPDGGVLCGISIRVTREDGTSSWITKWDGAENTDIEPIKGGLSSAMRRAAVQWGIGRYLYDLPSQWVPVDEGGRFRSAPTVPARYLPAGSGDVKSPVEAPQRSRPAQARTGDGATAPAMVAERSFGAEPAAERPAADAPAPNDRSAQEEPPRRPAARRRAPEPEAPNGDTTSPDRSAPRSVDEAAQYFMPRRAPR